MVEKAVLDTSVVISGLIGRGPSNKVLGIVLRGGLKAVLSPQMFREYVKAVHYPRLKVPILYAYALLSRLHALSEKVSPKREFNLSRDPEDNKFLEAAYEARARYIITLDQDLLALRDSFKNITLNRHKVKILSPKELLKEIAQLTE